MKKKPYFPKSTTALSAWSFNFKEKIAIHAGALGISPAEVTAEETKCAKMIDGINDVITGKTTFKEIVDARNKIIEVEGADLRKDIKRHKAAEGYTEAIGASLGIIGSDTEFDTSTFKPVITVEPFGNLVQVRFLKKGVNGINLYVRRRGEESFKLLSRATKSPFKYQPAMDESGKAVHWEYIAFGVIEDEEIGLASNTVSFVFSIQTT